jgi:hypothetical protein
MTLRRGAGALRSQFVNRRKRPSRPTPIRSFGTKRSRFGNGASGARAGQSVEPSLLLERALGWALLDRRLVVFEKRIPAFNEKAHDVPPQCHQ